MADIKFAERLRELRRKHDVSQRKFAETAGITAAALSAYEKAAKVPSVEAAYKIAEAFDVSLDWLCGREEQEPKTFADVVKILSAVVNADLGNLKCTMSRVLFGDFCLEFGAWDGVKDVPEFAYEVDSFLDKWENMIKLKMNGTIDANLYTLWLKDQLKRLDIPLNEIAVLEESDLSL